MGDGVSYHGTREASDQRELVIVRADDRSMAPLGGIPTPLLIQRCADGLAQEAWCSPMGIWRLRDDAYDAENKPADVPYVRVRVGWLDLSAGRGHR